MPDLSINNHAITVKEGSTILDACQALGIGIPTMCFMDGCKPFTSCMVCLVRDVGTNKLIPSCSALAQDGMAIDTCSDTVTTARRTALELLLSEHVGDCDAPCHRVCPSHIHIPQLIRCIREGDITAATQTLARAVPLATDPCADCKGRCENACRRRQHDGPVAIRRLIQYVRALAPEGLNIPPPELAPAEKRFNCSIGKLHDGEMDQFLQDAIPDRQVQPAAGEDGVYTPDEARQEASRCLRCDCRKANACKLRDFATDYAAKQRHFGSPDRVPVARVYQHADIVFEPGKCIKCGLCTRITEREQEPLGLTFIGRGFDVRVGVPFNAALSDALTRTAQLCVEACPTGALALQDGYQRRGASGFSGARSIEQSKDDEAVCVIEVDEDRDNDRDEDRDRR